MGVDDRDDSRLVTTREDIITFFETETGQQVDRRKTGDLFKDYGIDGDRAFAFVEAFAERFDVDMRDYCFYFHHRDQTACTSILPWGSPDRHVRRIPVSADLLLDVVHRGTWDLYYPRSVMVRAEREAQRERRLLDGFRFGLLAFVTISIAWLWLSDVAACRPDRAAEYAC